MNKQSIVSIIVLILAIIGLLAFYANRNNKMDVASETSQAETQSAFKNDDGDKMHMDDKMASKDEVMTSEDGKMANEDVAMISKSGSYKDYSQSAVETEFSNHNKVVLFFHAPWCPFCKAADAAFTSRVKEIPAGVTVLKTDYDSNGELKKKYGVTYQHTFVQIDPSGKMITKWNGGDIDSLKQNLK